MKKILLSVLIISSFLLVSCDKKDPESVKNENGSENEITETDENQNKEESGKNGKIEQSEEIPKTDNELGMTPGLPVDFPKDIPQPQNAKVLGSLTSSEGTVVTFESNDKVLDIVEYYKAEMEKNGFSLSEEGESLVSDKGGLINWSKGDKFAGLMLGFDKDKNITSLVITYN